MENTILKECEVDIDRIDQVIHRQQLDDEAWWNNLSASAEFTHRNLLKDLDELFDKFSSATACDTLNALLSDYVETVQEKDFDLARNNVQVTTELMAFLTKINLKWEKMRYLTLRDKYEKDRI